MECLTGERRAILAASRILAERVECAENTRASGAPAPRFSTHVTTLLVSHLFSTAHGARLTRAAAESRYAAELLALPPDPGKRLPEPECARAEVAYFSEDVFPGHSRQFFSAVRKAPKLKWLHVFNAGVDHPIYSEILARGVRLTTSSGAISEPIAQTVVMALLMLARRFPHYLEAQRERAWKPLGYSELPRDLCGQTALILGLGKIGAEIARLARALGLRVIGVRRARAAGGEPVDELHPPEALATLLPRCDWLIIACPLTPETRGLVDAQMIARLPKGAHLINIARGEIVHEGALIEALGSRHLAGAYLDVFEHEPLAPDSPLWELPNVIVSPHSSGAALGNEERALAIFLDNLARWHRGAPLVNEVKGA
jgi:phosphoglycerate dehydrogenase-like enzyme